MLLMLGGWSLMLCVLKDFHDSCTNNLHTSLASIGWKLTDDPDTYLTPGPFNL